MNEEDYHRYLAAFNDRDYAAMEAFFADDFALENAGFRVSGKAAFREFYAFFHNYCREEVFFRGFYPGKDSFVANVIIRFTGLRDLSPEVLAERGYLGMTPVPVGVSVDVEFLILYELDEAGLIRFIKGAIWVPASA